MVDSTLDHTRMEERVWGEFTIDKGAMTENSPPLGSPWVLVFAQLHQKFGLREMISFSRFAERAGRYFSPSRGLQLLSKNLGMKESAQRMGARSRLADR